MPGPGHKEPTPTLAASRCLPSWSSQRGHARREGSLDHTSHNQNGSRGAPCPHLTPSLPFRLHGSSLGPACMETLSISLPLVFLRQLLRSHGSGGRRQLIYRSARGRGWQKRLPAAQVGETAAARGVAAPELFPTRSRLRCVLALCSFAGASTGDPTDCIRAGDEAVTGRERAFEPPQGDRRSGMCPRRGGQGARGSGVTARSLRGRRRLSELCCGKLPAGLHLRFRPIAKSGSCQRVFGAPWPGK